MDRNLFFRGARCRQLSCFVIFCLISLSGAAQEFGDSPQVLVPARSRSDVERERLLAATMVMEARILEGRGEDAASLRKYQRAWRYDREARTLLKYIVPLALKLGRVDEATRYALLLTNSDLEDPFLAERLAMLMADQVEYDRSLQLYRHVLQLRGEDFEARHPIAMHFEMGRLYFLTQQYEQAARSFHVVLDAIDNPAKYEFEKNVREAMLNEPARIYTLFAESFLEAGEYADASALFERAATTDKKPGWLQLQLARVDYRAGRYRAAQDKLEGYVQKKFSLGGRTPYEILQRLLERATDSVGSQGNQEPDEQDGDPKNAIVSFRDWLTDDPDNFPLLSYVADLTRRRGGLKDAAALYEKSVAKQPTIEGYVGLATTYRKLKDTRKLLDLLGQTAIDLGAFELFEAEVDEVVQDETLLNSILKLGRRRIKEQVASSGDIAACGMMALKAERYDEAGEFFAHVEKSPEQLPFLIAWGMQLLSADQHQRAIEVFDSLLKVDTAKENESVIWFYLSAALQLDGQTERALELARLAVAEAPDVPDIALRPAWILYNAQRINEAYREYRQWLDKYSEDYSIPGIRESVREARAAMSDICLDTNRTDEAIEWLEKILDEYPSDVGVLNDLGYLLVDQDRSLDRATQMIRIAVKAEPDNVAYRDSLGWALYRQGRFREAAVELKKAASVEQPDPIILDHLGDALTATKEQLEANETWQQALKLLRAAEESPTNIELKRKIERKLKNESGE